MLIHRIFTLLIIMLLACPHSAMADDSSLRVVELFEDYMNNTASSQEVVGELLSEPEKYVIKAATIGEIIKSQNLLLGDIVTARKIYQLQSELNVGIEVHNKKVSDRRLHKGMMGAAAGAAVAIGGSWWLNRYDGYLVQINFIRYAIVLTLPGAVAGAAVANGIDRIYSVDKFEENTLLDDNE